jgi:iron complex outermembrane receptor protein
MVINMKHGKHQKLRTNHKPLYAILSGCSLLLATASAMAADDGDGAPRLETVTVTGEKMPRSLAKTTTAVSVFDSEELDKGTVSSVNEVAQKVPNATINPAGGMNIRGMEGTGPATGFYSLVGGGRPRVSTSVDGAEEVWTGQQYLEVGMWDVKQVEVLRGPQSTTQGRNAIGGAVLVETKDPVFYNEGAVRLGWETADGRANAAGMVSGPIVDDELAYRLVASGMKGNGYIQYKGSAAPNASETEHEEFRGKLLWKPKALPGLEAKLTVSHRKFDGDYLNTVNGNDVSAYTYTASSSNRDRVQHSNNTTTTLETNYDFFNGVTGHLLYSYGDNHIGFNEYPSYMNLGFDDKSHTLESRLVFKPADSHLSGVVGLAAYKKNESIFGSYPTYTLMSGGDSQKTLAVYADGEYAFTPAWSLLAGGRLEKNTQDRDLIYKKSASSTTLIQADIEENVFLPKLGVSYQWSKDTSMSLVAKKGYNPGGVSVTTDTYTPFEYDSETVNSYEYALKSRIAGINLGMNLFYNDFNHYQMTYGTALVNMPKAHTTGAEFTAETTLRGGLQIYGGIGLLRSAIDQAPTGSAAITGNQLTYAPETTINLGIKKQWGSWVSGVNWQYVGKYYTDAANTRSTMAGDYNLVNLDLSYALNKATTLRGYVKNALNETVTLGKRTTGFYVGEPRTFGVNAEYRF